MVAWFIIAAITLSVFAYVAVISVTGITTSYDQAARAETVRRMDAAANALLKASASPNLTGARYLPAGQTVGSIYTLPANLNQYATSGFGLPIVYCPFGNGESGTNTTIPSQDGNSYTVQVATQNGTGYVVGGRPTNGNFANDSQINNPNLEGFLMAARSRSAATPSCDSISYIAATNLFTSNDAIVRPIIAGLNNSATLDLTYKANTWYVSATGSGTGTNANDPASLTSALDFWRQRQPQSMQISFANGSYSFPAGFLDQTTNGYGDLGHNTSLILTGSAGNVAVTQSGPGNISIPVGSLTINGVNFDSGTNFIAGANTTITFKNAAGGAATAQNGGQIIVNSSTLSTASGSVLTANNASSLLLTGSVSLLGNTGSPIISIANGSTATLTSATTTTSLSSGTGGAIVTAKNGSSINTTNSSLIISGAWTAGIVIDNSSLSTSNLIVNNSSGSLVDLIQSQNGSQASLNNGGITGNKPTGLGFNDKGSVFIGGTAFGLKGTNGCWGYNGSTATAGVLSHSAAGTAGNTSIVIADTSPTLANNTASTIQSYVSQTSSNTGQDNIRASNQSAWTCS